MLHSIINKLKCTAEVSWRDLVSYLMIKLWLPSYVTGPWSLLCKQRYTPWSTISWYCLSSKSNLYKLTATLRAIRFTQILRIGIFCNAIYCTTILNHKKKRNLIKSLVLLPVFCKRYYPIHFLEAQLIKICSLWCEITIELFQVE